jgi:hypothetical protein
MTAEEIRDACGQWLADHRRECGDPTCGEPINFLAFLAHTLGVRQDHVGKLKEELAFYEAHCPDCAHLRN